MIALALHSCRFGETRLATRVTQNLLNSVTADLEKQYWMFPAEQETRTGTAQHGAAPAAPMLCAGSGPAGVTAQVADVVREDLDVHEAAALDQLP
jgi:hypothetical protein